MTVYVSKSDKLCIEIVKYRKSNLPYDCPFLLQSSKAKRKDFWGIINQCNLLNIKGYNVSKSIVDKYTRSFFLFLCYMTAKIDEKVAEHQKLRSS